jgi:hypothetical protein
LTQKVTNLPAGRKVKAMPIAPQALPAHTLFTDYKLFYLLALFMPETNNINSAACYPQHQEALVFSSGEIVLTQAFVEPKNRRWKTNIY